MDSRLEKLKQAVESAVEGMSGEQLSRYGQVVCGGGVGTSVLDLLGTIKGFERVMAGGKPLATRASMAQRCRALVVLGLGHMPTGREAPANTRPRGLPADRVRNEIGEKIVAMDAIIAQCETRFGHRTPLLDHPILGPLTATQWRKFHAVHGRHHEKQLLQLRKS